MNVLPAAVSLRDVTVVEPRLGTAAVRDLFVDHGRLVDAPPAAAADIDAAHLVAFPPLADVHVHYRDDILAAGAAGGFGTLVTMANQKPPIDSVEALRAIAADSTPAVRLLPSACVTRGRTGREVVDMERLAREGGAVAFTDDGTMVADDDVMLEAMTRAAALDLPVMDHAMVPSLMAGGVIRDCPLARELGLPIVVPETESAAVARDIALSRRTGCAVHIQHVSCAASADLIRAARAEGLRVSGEATPHHLLLAAEDIPCDDANWKMNPPLGTRADRDAVRQAVLDGTLSVLATDHAPHPADAKARGFREAPFGIVGLETALGASYQALVVECGMDLVEFFRRWTVGPGDLIRPCALPDGEYFRLGTSPRFVLADFSARHEVDPAHFLGGATNSPFKGMFLPGVILIDMWNPSL